MTINAPEYSMLEPPHKIDSSPKDARKSVYDLARNRIVFCTQEQHDRFQRDVSGEDVPLDEPSCMFLVGYEDVNGPDVTMERFVRVLHISVNMDYFKIGEENYSDLLPYLVKHEIYES